MTIQSPLEVDQPTLYSSLKAQSELHLTANSMANRLLYAPSVSAGEALVLNKPLTDWVEKVPPYLRLDHPPAASFEWYLFARSKLWWRYYNLQIILFRPLVLRTAMEQIHGKNPYLSSDFEECKRLCLGAAHHTTIRIQEYIERQGVLGRLSAWYTL
jgi:transcriptional regulatory protein GAL4